MDTTQISTAAIASAWLRRNIVQLFDGGRAPYISTPWTELPAGSDPAIPVHFSVVLPLPRFPTPECLEASPMPSQDCLKFHRLDCFKQIRQEPNHSHEDRPVYATQSRHRELRYAVVQLECAECLRAVLEGDFAARRISGCDDTRIQFG